MQRGFSTLEMMIAFAILATVLTGVILADFGSQYWTITSQTSNEALYKGKILLENLRADAKRDFLSATSTPYAPSDGACSPSSLCYWSETRVTDISECSKYASTTVSWQVSGYPTTTATLFTTFSDAQGVVVRGGDCGLNWPAGDWTNIQAATSPQLTGDPVGIDVMNGSAYIAENTAPYLEVVSGEKTYSYVSPDGAAFNAIDIARNLNPNQPFTYAYLAASSTTGQLQIIDVTDPTNIFPAATLTLKSSSVYPQGWRLSFYDRTVYILTKETSGSELHVADVRIPTSPVELGGGIDLNFTGTDIAVRDQIYQGAKHRLAYIASANNSNQLSVWDVTDPTNLPLTPINSCGNLAGGASQSNSVLTLLGNRVYVGLDPTGDNENLYAFDTSDPTSASFCKPIAHTMVNDATQRRVIGIRASGPYLFVATTDSSSNTQGQIQVRSSDPSTNFALRGTYPSGLFGGNPIASLVDNGIDFDSDANRLYTVVGGANPSLQILSSTP